MREIERMRAKPHRKKSFFFGLKVGTICSIVRLKLLKLKHSIWKNKDFAKCPLFLGILAYLAFYSAIGTLLGIKICNSALYSAIGILLGLFVETRKQHKHTTHNKHTHTHTHTMTTKQTKLERKDNTQPCMLLPILPRRHHQCHHWSSSSSSAGNCSGGSWKIKKTTTTKLSYFSRRQTILD